jgi:hypothetical protein
LHVHAFLEGGDRPKRQWPARLSGRLGTHSGYIALYSNRPAFFLQLVTSGMGQTSGAQIVVTDLGMFAVGRASGSHAFSKE